MTKNSTLQRGKSPSQERSESFAQALPHLPGDSAAAIDAACEDDRRWFEQNPNARFQFRDLLPDEFAPRVMKAGVRVVVWRLTSDLRMRCPVSGTSLPWGTDRAGETVICELLGKSVFRQLSAAAAQAGRH